MSRREAVMRRKQQMMYQRIAVVVLTALVIFFGVLLGSSIMASGKSTASEEHPSFKYYTSIRIEKGDTLWSIAEAHRTSEYDSIQDYIREIKELNHLGPDDIHAGQYLTIPYYSGEFLE